MSDNPSDISLEDVERSLAWKRKHDHLRRISGMTPLLVERSELWKSVAIAASARWIMPEQPVTVADAVLAAFDERFCGNKPPVKEKPPVETAEDPLSSSDPVDSIIKAFGG